jgi:hypothetical protein
MDKLNNQVGRVEPPSQHDLEQRAPMATPDGTIVGLPIERRNDWIAPAAPQQAVPEGWRIRKDADGTIIVQKSDRGGCALGGPYENEGNIEHTIFYAFLDDMLAAAPVPPVPAPVEKSIIGKLLDDFSELPVLWGLNEPGALMRHSDVFKMLVAAGKSMPATPVEQSSTAGAAKGGATSDLTTVDCDECGGSGEMFGGFGCDQCDGQGKIIVSPADLAAPTQASAPQEERAAVPSGYLFINSDDLMAMAKRLIAEDLPDTDEDFMRGRAHGIGSLHAEILGLAQKCAAPVAQEVEQSEHVAPMVEYVPIAVNSHDEAGGRHANDKTPEDDECQKALDARGDDRGQGLDPYWKWGYRAGWHDHKRLATPSSTEASAQAAPDAVRDVLAERRRQVEAEGWTPEHDDKYKGAELRLAALCYMRAETITTPGVLPGAWPWAANWWKPSTDRRNLVKAGALILAEIERIDHASLRTTSTQPTGEKGGAA